MEEQREMQMLSAPGCLIAFEGIDGSGKTTAAEHAEQHLLKRGTDVFRLSVQALAADAVPAQIKRITSDAKNAHITAAAETFLYLASLAQRVDEFILPARRAGRVVLVDRFTMSVFVLAHYARRVERDLLLPMIDLAAQQLRPNLTILYDVDVATSLRRKASATKAKSRKEQEGPALFEILRAGYLNETSLLGPAGVVLPSHQLDLPVMLRKTEELIDNCIAGRN